MSRKQAPKKAPRGWGQVRRFGDQYMADITIGGKRERPIFPTNALAEKFLESKRVEKTDFKAGRQGARAGAPGVTYKEAFDELELQYKAGIPRTLSRRTLKSYQSHIRLLRKRWRGPVIRTTTNHVDADVAAMRADRLSSSTIRHQLDRLSAVHQLCVRRGWLARVPCEITRPRLIMASEVDALPEDQYEAVLKAAHDQWEATTILLLAGDCGLRLSEIWRFDWRDIRYSGNSGSLHVRVEGETKRTKSGKGRNVPMTPRLSAHLASEKRARGPMVPGVKNENALTRRASRPWRTVLGTDAKLHRLRHRYGTALARNGVHVTVIQKLMGHADIKTTMRYLHTVPEVSADALRAIGGQQSRKMKSSESNLKH